LVEYEIDRRAAQARRLLALAAIYEGAMRTEAAKIGDVTLQIVRDWVVKSNAHGPDGLIDRKAPGQPPKLNDAHCAALTKMIEDGPTPPIHGVVTIALSLPPHRMRNAPLISCMAKLRLMPSMRLRREVSCPPDWSSETNTLSGNPFSREKRGRRWLALNSLERLSLLQSSASSIPKVDQSVQNFQQFLRVKKL
jgi:hypothetical protein